jgi:IS5 family transposase
METNEPIARRTRYRDLQSTVFGQPLPEWIVEHVYVVAGIEHARLVSARQSRGVQDALCLRSRRSPTLREGRRLRQENVQHCGQPHTGPLEQQFTTGKAAVS